MTYEEIVADLKYYRELLKSRLSGVSSINVSGGTSVTNIDTDKIVEEINRLEKLQAIHLMPSNRKSYPYYRE